MSAHTPGRVNVQHPNAGERGWEVAFEPGLQQLCQDITEANARRLVACWNACESIDTEYLEGDDSLPHYARRLMAQRDELLAALRGMMDAYMDLCDEAEPNYQSYEFRQSKWEAARAAIAKVTNPAGTGPANKKDAHS